MLKHLEQCERRDVDCLCRVRYWAILRRTTTSKACQASKVLQHLGIHLARYVYSLEVEKWMKKKKGRFPLLCLRKIKTPKFWSPIPFLMVIWKYFYTETGIAGCEIRTRGARKSYWILHPIFIVRQSVYWAFSPASRPPTTLAHLRA